jgi:hypothetical protein
MRISRPAGLFRRFASFAVVTMAASAVAVAGLTAPASAAVRGLNLQVSGCNFQAPGTTLVLRSNTVYGWKCFTGLYDLGIDMNLACRYTYGSASSAYYLNYWDRNSWRCR